MANSSQLSLPSKMAPSDHKLCVTVDSYVGIKFSSILLPAVVFTFFVQNKSLTAIGMPGNFLLKSGFESNSLDFFNDTATTEIYTSLFVGSVRCV